MLAFSLNDHEVRPCLLSQSQSPATAKTAKTISLTMTIRNCLTLELVSAARFSPAPVKVEILALHERHRRIQKPAAGGATIAQLPSYRDIDQNPSHSGGDEAPKPMQAVVGLLTNSFNLAHLWTRLIAWNLRLEVGCKKDKEVGQDDLTCGHCCFA